MHPIMKTTTKIFFEFPMYILLLYCRSAACGFLRYSLIHYFLAQKRTRVERYFSATWITSHSANFGNNKSSADFAAKIRLRVPLAGRRIPLADNLDADFADNNLAPTDRTPDLSRDTGGAFSTNFEAANTGTAKLIRMSISHTKSLKFRSPTHMNIIIDFEQADGAQNAKSLVGTKFSGRLHINSQILVAGA